MNRYFFGLVGLGLLCVVGNSYGAANRTALVIGNAEYPKIRASLPNPVNDARDIAETLRSLGFKVLIRTNASKREMDDAIDQFATELQDRQGVGLFYYAGHGAQVKRQNYLIPTDARVKRALDADIEAVNARLVLNAMETAGNSFNIMILDACRNNPYPGTKRSVSQGGLAVMNAPSGTIIAYSTAPGKVAYDGDGENGLYTEELLRHMKHPGLKLEDVFKRVRRSVRERSIELAEDKEQLQVPWEHSSIFGDFYFVPQSISAQSLNSIQSDVGGLQVYSKPSGATVFVDGKKWGKTPLVVNNLPIGKVRIRSAKEGFMPYEQVAMIQSDTIGDLHLTLETIPLASITIESEPQGAKWYLSGDFMGLTPDRMDALELGDYEIRVEHIGYHPWQSDIRVSSGKPTQIIANLQKRTTKSTSTEGGASKKSGFFGVVQSGGKQDQQNTKQNLDTERPNFKVRESFLDNLKSGGTAPEMIIIPAGSFEMGDKNEIGDPAAQPVHLVSIPSDFAMGKYEVTFDEYDRFAEVTERGKPDDFGWGRGRNPVVNVSWLDAHAYTQWLTDQTGKSYRLPTEAEWEYATRAQTQDTNYWGGAPDDDSDQTCKFANVADLSLSRVKSMPIVHTCNDGYVNLSPVGRFSPNTFGLFDTLGNAAEWTASVYVSPYRGLELNSSGIHHKGKRSIRGGSWSSQPYRIRAASRVSQAVKYKDIYIGFRVVQDLN